MTSFTEILLDSSSAEVKPASDFKDNCSKYKKMLIPKNRMTPVILCKIEAIAASGNLIVVMSKLIGRFMSTANPLIFDQ